MDARNISRQSLIKTLNTFEERYSSTIITINEIIDDAINDIKFEIKIKKDDVPNINEIGNALVQYYTYRGYGVLFNTGDEMNGIEPYIRIYWDFQNISQPYEP